MRQHQHSAVRPHSAAIVCQRAPGFYLIVILVIDLSDCPPVVQHQSALLPVRFDTLDDWCDRA